MKKNIFKRVLAGLSVVAVMGCLTGCNNKIKVEYQYDAAQYVTLGEYKGLEVSIDRAEVENEIVEAKIQEDIQNYTEYTEVKREAKEEDKVTVSFSGTISGMLIEGFSGEDSEFVLGKDKFLIDGFIEALYGMKSGDNKIVTLTVPENFTENADYAGKRIVYDISMKKVEQVTVPMMTDGFVKQKFGIETVAEYKETLKKNLSSKVDEQIATIKKEKVLLKLQENATVNGYPEEYLAKKQEEFESSIKVFALMQELTNDEYCQKYFGFSFDDYVKKAVAQDAIIQLVVKQEQLYISEYEYKDKLEPFALSQGYTNKEAFVEKFGKNEIVKNMLFEKAQNFVIDSAVVK